MAELVVHRVAHYICTSHLAHEPSHIIWVRQSIIKTLEQSHFGRNGTQVVCRRCCLAVHIPVPLLSVVILTERRGLVMHALLPKLHIPDTRSTRLMAKEKWHHFSVVDLWVGVCDKL